MKIRYKLIKELVTNLFINLNITEYPIDIFNIFSSYKNIKVISYSKHMKKYNLTDKEVITHLGSEEGCTIYKQSVNRYIIFYNDLETCYKTVERRLWTLTHELGHILLNHHLLSDKTKIFRNNLSDIEYKWLEVEANRFASLLLANPAILNELRISDYHDIMNICKLSKTASINRFKYLTLWQNNHTLYKDDLIIIKQFSHFINKKYCSICNTYLDENAENYCPICGNNKFKWGDGKVIYSKIEINEKHKAKICPVCKNELTDIEGNYCQICGSYIANMCTNWNCNNLLEGDMRYCPSCGHASTFLKFGLLNEWKNELIELDSDDLTESDFDDITF